MTRAPLYCFGGGDPAPAQTAGADDGVIVVLAAQDRRPQEVRESPGREAVPSDFRLFYPYARVIRDASPREWSGLIHRLNDNFGFNNFALDPGGGGLGIRKELASTRQLIEGVECDRVPLVTRDDVGVVEGRFILTLVSRRDPGIQALWPSLLGDDVLKSQLHTEMYQALHAGLLTLPPKQDDVPRARREAWPDEKRWALSNLEAGVKQLGRVTVITNHDGTQVTTKNGVRKFATTGRDDIAMALIYAYIAFLVWLRMGGAAGEEDGSGSESDEMRTW